MSVISMPEKFQPPKGTKDFLPEEAGRVQLVCDTIRKVYEKYGFAPLDTPAFENFELLSAKGAGESVRNEIYNFKDKGGRELGLRFDFTVPLGRVVANNPNLPKPFKRYQIGKVWRYDNPQALRYREFLQADIDTVGSAAMLADAECVAAVCECLQTLGIKDFFVRVNNRKLLDEIFESAGVAKEKIFDVFRIVDKMDKIGAEGVRVELEKNNFDSKKILPVLKMDLEEIEKKFENSAGLRELKEFFKFSKALGIEKFLKFDISLVRGLDYYTGPVFEISIGKAKVSCGAGGRYDNLVRAFGGQDLPATGISIGVSRVVAVMEEERLFKNFEQKKIFVAVVNDFVRQDAIKVCRKIHEAGKICSIDLTGKSLGKQFEFAAAGNFNFVAIVGPEEMKKNSVKIRDMKTGAEKNVKISELEKFFKNF